MRVMVFVHANEDSEQGNYADHVDEFEAMGKYNEELVKAGILLAGEGLQPSSQGNDWTRIVVLYEALSRLTPSPVIELNRAVAVAMSDGPDAALAIVDSLADEPALRGYYLLPAVRADLLARLGRPAQARAEFERAAALTGNDSERAHLLRRAAGV